MDRRSKSVFVVDDDDSFRRMLKRLLEKNFDYAVIGDHANGEEALNRLAYFVPDLILMDVDMPVMDGISATQLIKQRFPDLLLVALSGLQHGDYVTKMLSAGAARYILKGGTSNELMEALDGVIHRVRPFRRDTAAAFPSTAD